MSRTISATWANDPYRTRHFGKPKPVVQESRRGELHLGVYALLMLIAVVLSQAVGR